MEVATYLFSYFKLWTYIFKAVDKKIARPSQSQIIKCHVSNTLSKLVTMVKNARGGVRGLNFVDTKLVSTYLHTDIRHKLLVA